MSQSTIEAQLGLGQGDLCMDAVASTVRSRVLSLHMMMVVNTS